MTTLWETNEEEKVILNKIKDKRKAIVITVNMFKGGVGKSTVSNLLGYIIDKYNLKGLFIDTDPQRTLTKKFNKNFNTKHEAELSFMDGIKKGTLKYSISKLSNNIDIIKGDWNLAWFDRYSRKSLKIRDEFFVYDDLIEDLKENYDFIFLDSVPTTTTLTHNCVVASDYVIVPVESEEDCYENSMDYMFYLSQMKQYNKKLDVLGVLIYLTEDDNKTNNLYIEKYNNEFDDMIFSNIINRSRRVMTWGADGITENKPYDKKTLNKYVNVFWEIMDRLEKRGALNE
ncbi:ParA family protein [Staphylococcus kloosii]|jgi:chromosome partitioning protein|uniref:ParA family protein n=1 Tax=Staphylococcus kloosii TaxID=29384 RepID=UPI00189E80D4|nr:ParA family protein [Staphylococcus kloosii]MBF7023276.1 ParA family protein [Staphylococcus kloosii]MBF7025999.1 ParA family protein [Staphylococcus kloosii]